MQYKSHIIFPYEVVHWARSVCVWMTCVVSWRLYICQCLTMQLCGLGELLSSDCILRFIREKSRTRVRGQHSWVCGMMQVRAMKACIIIIELTTFHDYAVSHFAVHQWLSMLISTLSTLSTHLSFCGPPHSRREICFSNSAVYFASFANASVLTNVST